MSLKNSNQHNLLQKLRAITTFESFEKSTMDSELWESVAHEIISLHQLSEFKLERCEEGKNIVFYYGNFIIKLFPPFHEAQWENERLVLKHLFGKLSVPTPELKYAGEIQGWPYLVMTRLSGILLEQIWTTLPHHNKLILIEELGKLIHEVHSLPIDDLAIDFSWQDFLEQQIKNCIPQHQNMQLTNKLLPEMPSYIESIKSKLFSDKQVLLTGEYTPMNLLVEEKEGIWHMSGLFDFGDAMLGLPQYDLLGPGAFLVQGDKELLLTFFLAYGYSPNKLIPALSHQLTALMLLHQYSNLDRQLRIDHWQDRVNNLKDLENLVWGF